VPPLLSWLPAGRKYPGIELTLAEDETDALLDGLAAGDLHTAFLGLGPGQELPASLQAITVAREPVVLAVHPQHPLAALRTGGRRRCVTIAITHPTTERRIILAWRPGATSPAARAFITLAREHLGQRAAAATG
jgi:DNA-binding transcriptional LysR family regulator